MRNRYTLTLNLLLLAGGITLSAQNSRNQSPAPQEEDPGVIVALPIGNHDILTSTAAYPLNLQPHFDDATAPGASLNYSILSNSAPDVVTLQMVGADLLITPVGAGQTTVVVQAERSSRTAKDTFCIGVQPVIDGPYDLADMNELPLDSDSYWNGSDGSGAFQSGILTFHNTYVADPQYPYWSGFAYSNKADVATAGFMNQYSAFDATPFPDENIYAIGYEFSPLAVTTSDRSPRIFKGFSLINTTYAALSMKQGDFAAKKFGGETGDDPDWFKLTIEGFTAGSSNGTSEVMLADYTASDNALDHILETWQWVDLESLGALDSLTFSFSSSDNGDWGMNTPAYVAMDNFYVGFKLGLIETQLQNVTVYPNPAANRFTLQLESDHTSDLTLMDMQGRVVLLEEDFKSGDWIDVEHLNQGIYLVRISSGQRSATKRIFIQR